MKNTIIIILILLSPGVFAQDTLFYKNYLKVSSLDQCDTYQVIKRDEVDSTKFLLDFFYKSGQIKSRSTAFNIDNIPRFNGGLIEEWYENGQLHRKYFFKSAISLHGEVLSYHKDGSIRRKEVYDDGSLIKGQIFNENGIEVPYSDFIIPASFPGGNNALMGYLLKNIKYPPKLLKKQIEGTVQVKFIIDLEGSIKEVTIHEGVNDSFDKEALRVVKKMPKWTPRIFDGDTELSYFILPVIFRIVEE